MVQNNRPVSPAAELFTRGVKEFSQGSDRVWRRSTVRGSSHCNLLQRMVANGLCYLESGIGITQTFALTPAAAQMLEPKIRACGIPNCKEHALPLKHLCSEHWKDFTQYLQWITPSA